MLLHVLWNEGGRRRAETTGSAESRLNMLARRVVEANSGRGGTSRSRARRGRARRGRHRSGSRAGGPARAPPAPLGPPPAPPGGGRGGEGGGGGRRTGHAAARPPPPPARGRGRPAPATTRRRFLTGALALGATLPIAGWGRPGCHRPPQPPARLPDGLFRLGVASGDPLPHRVVLWTRLAPAPLEGGRMPAVAVPVRRG